MTRAVALWPAERRASGWELVAEALAGAGGHDKQDVAAGGGGFADFALVARGSRGGRRLGGGARGDFQGLSGHELRLWFHVARGAKSVGIGRVRAVRARPPRFLAWNTNVRPMRL